MLNNYTLGEIPFNAKGGIYSPPLLDQALLETNQAPAPTPASFSKALDNLPVLKNSA